MIPIKSFIGSLIEMSYHRGYLVAGNSARILLQRLDNG
jgi:hypothetical protein